MKEIRTHADWSTAPYEQYLLVTDGGETRAYPIADDEPLDLEAQLTALYPDCELELTRAMGGPSYAAIITDGRPPNSVVVWQSGDFYVEPND